MQDEKKGQPAERQVAATDEGTRPQQPGEGGTTRFGMEDGDNTEVPATGGPQAEPEVDDQA